MAAISEHPLWRNIVLRTVIYYLLAAGIAYLLRPYYATDLGILGAQSLAELVGGVPSGGQQQAQSPSALAAGLAMLTAFATSLPVAWIYTLTRRKKGFQQSVVQTYLILPVVTAGIVVLVKYSLTLAFSLGGIVAAVRFRTTLDDSKDAAGVFVVIGIGMAAAVTPSVSWVISIGFNVLMIFLWTTDFGQPAALDEKAAEKGLEKALESHNRTGMFLARMDEEVLKDMSPDQLDALSERAWRRKMRNDPEMKKAAAETAPRPTHDRMLRIRTVDHDRARELCEPCFDSLFSSWKYLGRVHENEILVLEYGVTLADTVTPGVVSDDLGAIPDSPLRGVEMR